jgi:hypothetical protein
VLIGKEARNRDRIGITDDPATTIYSEPDDDAWRHAYLPTLRTLAPHLLGRGRPSQVRRAELVPTAGELAREELRKLKPEQPTPDGVDPVSLTP